MVKYKIDNTIKSIKENISPKYFAAKYPIIKIERFKILIIKVVLK